MANTITKQILANGSKYYIVKITIVGDGSGEETATRLNTTSGDMGTNPTLLEVETALSGFSARLLWDATTDVMICQIPSDDSVKLCFKGNPLPNNAGTGKTGDILITTSGLGNGDSGHIILKVQK